jgi:hypothetical protein
VWHLTDWVWHDKHRGQDSKGPEFDAYRNRLLKKCPGLGWLRDVAEAGKHRGLGRKSLEVAGAEQHRPHLGALGQFGLGGGPVSYVLVLEDGSHQDFAEVLRKATDFWRTDELKKKNLPSPFG